MVYVIQLAINKPVWHTPLLCVQWKTPVDRQRNCPKHVEFYSKNKFEKLLHLVGFIIRSVYFVRVQLLHIYIYIYMAYVLSFLFFAVECLTMTAMPKHVPCIIRQGARDAIWLGTVNLKMSAHTHQRASYQYSEPKVSTCSIICI